MQPGVMHINRRKTGLRYGENANVLALREVHIDDVYVYMIMDLCDGGELFDRGAQRPAPHVFAAEP